MIHANYKQNQRKHRKMERRRTGDKTYKGSGVLNTRCKWARRRGLAG